MPDNDPRSEQPGKRLEQRTEGPAKDVISRLRQRKHGVGTGGAGQYAGLGLQFVVAILVFLYAGNWIDGRLGTGPLFLVLGVFLGAGAAFYSIYKKVMAEEREAKAERDEE